MQPLPHPLSPATQYALRLVRRAYDAPNDRHAHEQALLALRRAQTVVTALRDMDYDVSDEMQLIQQHLEALSKPNLFMPPMP